MKKIIVIAAIAFAGCMSNKQMATEKIEFEAEEAYPEGIAYDSMNNVYYVSSARLGTIGKVTPGGQYSVLLADNTLKSTYGLKMQPGGRRLYACAGDANFSKYTSPDTRTKMARLIIIELPGGRKVGDIDLSHLVAGKHFPNDMAFDNKGNVYITDSYAHAIYKVDANGKASLFAKDKMFETEGVGLNGIVYHPGGYLLTANAHTGSVYKVDINDPKRVSKVNIPQYFLGADGLLLKNDNNLVMVVNGGSDKIFQLTTDNGWQSAKLSAATMAADRFAYPATATWNGNDTWVMNAKFNELADSNSVPSKKFSIQKAVLRPVPGK